MMTNFYENYFSHWFDLRPCLQVMGRSIACLMLLGTTLGLTGCTNLLHGNPPRYVNTTDAVSSIAFTSTEVKSLVEASDDTARNKIMNRAVAVIDLYFFDFARQLSANRQDGNALAEGSILGLNVAGTLTKGLTAKTNLAAAGALIAGGSGIIDKNYFYEKTVPALVSMMEAGRIAKLSKIQEAQNLDIAAYNGSRALADLEEYFAAGTVSQAIALVVAKSEDTKQEALINKLQPIGADQKVRRKSIAAAISKMTDITKGNAALANLGLPRQESIADVQMSLSMALRPTTSANIKRVEDALVINGLLTNQ
jgi:hypothetical protein